MIDPLDLPEDVPDFDWFSYPILSRAEMLPAICRCKELDGRAVNLFKNALTLPPRSGLLDQFLAPNLYHPGSHYLYTTPDPDRYKFKNWHPQVTAAAVEDHTIMACSLISNPIAWIDEAELAPKERTCNVGFAIQTIEFDSLPVNEQLAVIYSGKLKRIDAEFCRYRDYRGHEVVYGANKSFHFHFVFDLRHLKHDVAFAGNSSFQDNWTQDLPDCLLRPAYRLSWERLATIFCDIAEIDRERFPPDPSLNQWEHLRRCPWALRLVLGAHPLGLPCGHRIPQPVLASKIFNNAKRGATEWFYDAEKLTEQCRDELIRRPKRIIEPEFKVSSQELTLFHDHAETAFNRIIGGEYPKYAYSEITEAGVKCYFWNGPYDRNPSSFCDGNRSRILLQGRHDFVTDGVTLSATPNEVFNWIVAQHKADGDPPPDDWLMRRYKAVVQDRASLSEFLDYHLIDMVASEDHSHVMIRGPQGCGKSTKTMARLPVIYDRDPGLIAFSSPSIAQAEEKIGTFQRVNEDDRFVPFLYLSLTALYSKFCPPAERIGHLDVLEEGGSSWLHTIHHRQPDIYQAMVEYRNRLVELKTAGKIPVLFCTHETLRQHAAEGMTRTFWAAGFSDRWFEPMAKEERNSWKQELLWQNDFHRVIVDEVTAHDLVSIHPHDVVGWVQQCVADISFEHIEDSAERYAKFTRYLAEHPCPEMSWDLLLEVLGCKYTPEHIVEVSGREIPFDERDGIYASRVGDLYYVRPRGWWNNFWRVSLLTTEAVPTRIIEAIDREATATGEVQDDRFKIYELTLPESSKDTVTVELQNDCQKKKLLKLVRAYQSSYPNTEIISDMVKSRISEFSVTTHMSAKGSNAYIGSDVIAFYNALSPALFAELGALNSRFERSDMVRSFYLDRFEQTTGRNRGFRGYKGGDHRAVFPPKLHNWLAPALSGASYVPVRTEPSVKVGHNHKNKDVDGDVVLASAPAALLRNAGLEPSNGLQ